MVSNLRKLLDQWRQCDPLIRMFTYTCLAVLLWRIGIALLAFPSVKLNFNDYIWMTKFFGLSDLMYLALVFSGFGLIPSFLSALFLGSILVSAAVVCFRMTRRSLLYQLVVFCTGVIGITITIIISPSLNIITAQVLPTVIEGASVPIWIPSMVEYAFGIMVCHVLARKYNTDMSRSKRKEILA